MEVCGAGCLFSCRLLVLHYNPATTYPGNGTPSNPYRIFTASQLNEVGITPSDMGACFILISDIEDLSAAYLTMPLRQIKFGQLVMRTFDVMRRHRVRPPAQFTLMLKSLATVESLACSLDPDFSIIEHLKPYAARYEWIRGGAKKMLREARRAVRDAGDLAARLPDDVRTILNRIRKGSLQVRIHHEHLENLIHTLDKSSNRISFALIIAALLIGSSLLVPQEGLVLGLIRLQTLGVIGYITAAIIGIWLLFSIIRSRHL